MVRKRAVRKQQDTSQPLTQLRSAAEAFNTAVAQCAEDAEVEAVHRVRTGSRRLQAMLEATLREVGDTVAPLKEPAEAWLRRLKQARQAAGAVRDLDVHRKLLERWTDAGEAGPLQKQAELVDHWIKDKRKDLAHGMQKQMRKRQPQLLEQQDAVLAVMEDLRLSSSRKTRAADVVALEVFVRANDAMPVLDAENLHDFRKATKKARYVAEAGAEQNDSSVANALKRIQDSIGVWHDWQCLAKEAREQDAPELTDALDSVVTRRFAMALKTTETMRGQLLGEWMAAKRPPASVSHERYEPKRLRKTSRQS
jgi:CHAD domain-containing protein